MSRKQGDKVKPSNATSWGGVDEAVLKSITETLRRPGKNASPMPLGPYLINCPTGHSPKGISQKYIATLIFANDPQDARRVGRAASAWLNGSA